MELRGAFTALVTPFDKGGAIDIATYRMLLEFQVGNGISGLVIGGTTGEGATLERGELMELLEIACETVGERVTVIAGCGANDTARAVRMTRESARKGADLGLSVVPYYNRPSQEGLFAHFTAIAEEGDLPILLYNVPSRTGTNLAPETVARLARHPRIVGIKEASGDLRQVEKIISECPEGFTVLSGDDGLTYAIMALGGEGIVSVTSNILPGRVSSMVDAMSAGRWGEAMRLHRDLSALNSALFIDTNPVPSKEALGILGVEVGAPRLPLVCIKGAKRDELASVIEGYAEEFHREWDPFRARDIG